MAKTKEQARKIQEHMASFFDNGYKDLLSEVQSYIEGYGGGNNKYKALKDFIEGGTFEVYFDDVRKFLTELYNTPEEDQKKYSDETVWQRYVSLLQMELDNILRNPDGGGKNYIAQQAKREIPFDGKGINSRKANIKSAQFAEEGLEEQMPQVVKNFINERWGDDAVVDINTVDDLEIEIEVDGETWLFLEDDVAEDRAFEYVKQLLEEIGVSGLNVNLADFINEGWFADALDEMNQNYIEDIRGESASSDEYEDRLAEEMAEAGVEDEDEFLQWLTDNAGDPVQYYIDNFGESDFNEVIIAQNLVNLDGLSEYIVETDGRGAQLSGYDGNEEFVGSEDGNDWYAYRTN